jgi:hypothetical protein
MNIRHSSEIVTASEHRSDGEIVISPLVTYLSGKSSHFALFVLRFTTGIYAMNEFLESFTCDYDNVVDFEDAETTGSLFPM